MLQASEYQPAEYLRWLRRVKDFSKVQHRQRLVYTPKALLLLGLLWVFAVALSTYLALFWLMSEVGYGFKLALLIGAALIFPYLVAYGLAVVTWLLDKIVKAPLEMWVVRKARRRLAGHPAIKIAVAGSYGKTSFREILKATLSASKKVAAPPHSYNTPLGIAKFINSLEGDEEVLIFEFGENYPGDVKKLSRLVTPGIGIITGVNEAHLERFKDLERTRGTIFELADYLGNKPLYVNGEDKLASKAASKKYILYSRKGSGGWIASGIQTDLGGTRFEAKHAGQAIKVKSRLLGLHQVGPLLAAIAIASRLGLKPPEIEKGINRTQPFAHRLQPQPRPGGVTVIDDAYNGNPDGVKAAIAFLAGLKAKRKIYMTPGLVEMGARNAAVHREIGRRLAAVADMVILIRNSATPHIAAGLKAANFKGQLRWFDDALDAYAALDSFTRGGDVVLLQNDWSDQYA